VIGIIGRNGAGKSTLLKILSRITEPTQGFADVYGRVGSLLEVGTGFHPELTGRENIFLNGAILGMHKAEIEQKFDEIVEFSGIGKFIDTPVKQYSSGMYVRLAFAVAAHLEPEILIIDEVLAVGDVAFQKKCLGKMGDITRQGRTVLFVSHNMAAVKNLCNRAIWLEEGRIKTMGDVDEVIASYENEVLISQDSGSEFKPIVNKQHGFSLEMVKAGVIRSDSGWDLQIESHIRSVHRIPRIGIGVTITTTDGTKIANLSPRITNIVLEEVDGGCLCILEVPDIQKYLASGEYIVHINLTYPGVGVLLQARNAANFQVPEFDLFGSGYYYTLNKYGVVPLPIKIKEIIQPSQTQKAGMR
jgi:lipopolysaccharide transport system ATP-binding protein